MRAIATITAATVCVASLNGARRGPDQATPRTLTITTLSSRPDLVSGGDALFEITMGGAAPERAVVRLNGQDVSRAFAPDRTRGSLVGLVEGMQVGRNTILAEAGGRTARLEVVNSPIAGPIVSGPHLTPFQCKTEDANLGPPLDANCSARTKVEYFYKSSSAPSAPATPAVPADLPPGFKPLPDASEMPADLAQTTTTDGTRVPYIVRVESGTINRSIYRIAITDDRARGGSAGAWRPGASWNHRLIFSFGGGCGTNYHQGVSPMGQVLFDSALARGFAHVVSTQNALALHCNDHLSGEALMMIKEHFIERYGLLVWTMGFGGSGGAIQQLLITQNFPGLLDGLVPLQAFADNVTVRASTTDCRLLINYYKTNPATWTQEKQTAVEGYAPGTCGAWDRTLVNNIVADFVPGCGIAPELIYDAAKNPTGARCTYWDTNVATFGRDPATGFARRTLDNVGVQYGLAPLNGGALTPDEFLDLNEKIGGFDNDGHMQVARNAADPEALRLAYAAGRVNAGTGLDRVPILQIRRYADAAGDIHSRERDFAVRERLIRANGRAGNHVMWLFADPAAPFPGPPSVVSGLAIDTMRQWLDALVKDSSRRPALDKVVAAKPAVAVDACWDATGVKIEEPASPAGSGKCNALYPVHGTPRLVAGATTADDVLKCALKPIDAREYRVTLTPGELTRLRRIFPSGVCDYSKAGVGQRPPAGTYLKLPLLAR